MKMRCYISFISAIILTNLTYNKLEAQTPFQLDSTKKVIITAHPILGYTPETKLMFGLGGFVFLKNKSTYKKNSLTEINQINPFFIYTLNKQIRFVTSAQFYINRNYIDGRLEISKFPDYYFGVGNFTNSESEIFTQRIFRFTCSYMRRINYQIQAGVVFEAGKVKNEEIINGGLLETDSNHLPISSANTGIGPNFLWDKRDNAISPHTGYYLHTYYIYRPEFLNEFAFHKYYFDFRKYFPLFSKNSMLALQLKSTLIFGETVPLYYYTQLGGETRLRGIIANRYIDHKMAFVQAEYRQMVNPVIGFVVFTGAGRVGKEIADVKPDHLRYCVGGGMRFVLLKNPAFRFRIDCGYGTDKQVGIYAGLYEVF